MIAIKFGPIPEKMADAISTPCEACAVRDRALCSALSADELALLNGRAIRRDLARGDALFREGDALLCGNIISGVLKLVARDAEGVEQIVALLFPGDFAGRLDGPEPYETVALGPAQACLFPRGMMAGALERNRGMEQLLLERTRASVDEARARMHLLLRGSAEARVEALLRDFARRAGSARFTLPMTRGDMADLLGLTLETVSRCFARLKARGVVETEGRSGVRLLA